MSTFILSWQRGSSIPACIRTGLPGAFKYSQEGSYLLRLNCSRRGTARGDRGLPGLIPLLPEQNWRVQRHPVDGSVCAA